MTQTEIVSDYRGPHMYEHTETKVLEKLCDENDTWAMMELSRRYMSGNEVVRNERKSETLRRRAIDYGNRTAKAFAMFERSGDRSVEYRGAADSLCRYGNSAALMFYSVQFGREYYQGLNDDDFESFLNMLIGKGDSVFIERMFTKGDISTDDLRTMLHEIEGNIDRLCLSSLESLYNMYVKCELPHDMERVSKMIVDAAMNNYAGNGRIPGTVGISKICKMGLTDSTRDELETLVNRIAEDRDESKDNYGLLANSISESFFALGDMEKAKDWAMEAISRGCPFVSEDMLRLLPKEEVIEKCIKASKDCRLVYATLIRVTEGEERLRYARMGAKVSDMSCLRLLQKRYEKEGNCRLVIACELRNELATFSEESFKRIVEEMPELKDQCLDGEDLLLKVKSDMNLKEKLLEKYPLEQ